MLVVLLNVKGERGGLTPDVKKAASEKGSNMSLCLLVKGEGIRS